MAFLYLSIPDGNVVNSFGYLLSVLMLQYNLFSEWKRHMQWKFMDNMQDLSQMEVTYSNLD